MRTTYRICIVDDDASVRKAMRRFFESEGYGVEAYGSAEEFLQAGAADKIDCLVLDVHLGGASGLALLGELRRTDKQFPIVFITANGEHEQARIQALAAGASDFLRKQVDGERLLEAIQHALREI